MYYFYTITILTYQHHRRDLYSSLSSCREYIPGTSGIKGAVDKEYFEKLSADFAIGANQNGCAVFKDPEQAFQFLKENFGDGIRLIREEYQLPPLSQRTYPLYGNYGWQVIGGNSEQKDQAYFVSRFMDIYENSFAG